MTAWSATRSEAASAGSPAATAYPVPEVYAGALFFPFERAGEILQAWRAWVDGTPDEVTSVGRLIRFPPVPQVPEPVRGKSFRASHPIRPATRS
ncbi:MAG: hypothetical protein ACRDNG_10215 [Gaiellaceae bacterium]